jgi:hypothetical protein
MLPLLAACVSHGPQSQIGTQAKAEKQIRLKRSSDCVFVSTISDFTALDDRHVVLYSMGQRKAYLAEITRRLLRREVPVSARDRGRRQQRPDLRLRARLDRLPPHGHRRGLPIMGLEDLSDERREALGSASPKPKPKKEKAPMEEKKSGETK